MYSADVDTPVVSLDLPNGVPINQNEAVEDIMPIKVRYLYYIRCTKSKNLPVYNVGKHGGSYQATYIHHVAGDPRVSLSALWLI
jgi:hypothetical protein